MEIFSGNFFLAYELYGNLHLDGTYNFKIEILIQMFSELFVVIYISLKTHFTYDASL